MEGYSLVKQSEHDNDPNVERVKQLAGQVRDSAQSLSKYGSVTMLFFL